VGTKTKKTLDLHNTWNRGEMGTRIKTVPGAFGLLKRKRRERTAYFFELFGRALVCGQSTVR